MLLPCAAMRRKNCPYFPGKTQLIHRGFDDPPKLAEHARSEEEALGFYRRVRDEIKAFVETLPESLENGNNRKHYVRIVTP